MLLLVCVAGLEAASYVGGRILQSKYSMFKAPVRPADAPGYAEYLAARDPILGWPKPAQMGGPVFRQDGSRPSPANDAIADGAASIAVYGDSFAQSVNADDQTWANNLARGLGRRVKNFGVGGYGLDQAYLRFVGNEAERSAIALLCMMPEDIIRNLTHNRDLLTQVVSYAYKPRFVLAASGQLDLVPIPQFAEDQHRRFLGIDRPWHLVGTESFQPGTAAGITELRFPFTLSIVRNFGYFRLRARFDGRPEHAEFYEKDHPLRGLQITARIFRLFRDRCKERGQTPYCVILPSGIDVGHRARTGAWCYQSLIDELTGAGMQVLDFGPALVAAAAHEQPEKYFDGTSHYTPLGDRLLSDFLVPVFQDHPGLK